MSLIFPRAAAFAERTWTNPRAISWTDLAPNGAPPGWYWDQHVKDALARLNSVVENFDMRGVGVTRLQPKFCHDNPEYCTNYTNPFMHPSPPAPTPGPSPSPSPTSTGVIIGASVGGLAILVAIAGGCYEYNKRMAAEAGPQALIQPDEVVSMQTGQL
jgi:hypothetical protein